MDKDIFVEDSPYLTPMLYIMLRFRKKTLFCYIAYKVLVTLCSYLTLRANNSNGRHKYCVRFVFALAFTSDMNFNFILLYIEYITETTQRTHNVDHDDAATSIRRCVFAW